MDTSEQSCRQILSGLIDEEDGVASWRDRLGDFREVRFIASVLASRIRAALLPCFGQMALKK
jgi:hypothetical protein